MKKIKAIIKIEYMDGKKESINLMEDDFTVEERGCVGTCNTGIRIPLSNIRKYIVE